MSGMAPHDRMHPRHHGMPWTPWNPGNEGMGFHGIQGSRLGRGVALALRLALAVVLVGTENGDDRSVSKEACCLTNKS